VQNGEILTTDEEVLNSEETSKFCKLSKATLSYFVQNGMIPFVRMGKRNVRFLRSDLIAWMKERKNIPYRKGGD
jgi:excisionase family DNA binding protein